MDRHTYLQKIRQSKEKVYKEEFWCELWKEVSKRLEFARDKCEENKEDTRFYQGKSRALREVMGLPDGIIKELEEG